MSTKPFASLRDSLYETSPDSRDRVAAQVEDLRERLGLRELRQRLNKTQTDIAKAIGTSQPGISRIEAQDDAMVSTVRDYVRATGGTFSMLASYPDSIYELTLGDHAERADRDNERRFRIIWQDAASRKLVQVARLHTTPHNYVLHYTPAAATEPSFSPFDAFPDLRTTYHSPRLWPFFTDALFESVDTAPERLVEIFELPDRETVPVELLARGVHLDADPQTRGTAAHSTIQIVPEPSVTTDGEVSLFLASGLRHVQNDEPVNDHLADLQPGDELALEDEPTNEANPRAVRLRGPAGQNLGYVPDHLLDYLHKHRQSGDVTVTVVRANGPEVSNWHLRLLCKMHVAY